MFSILINQHQSKIHKNKDGIENALNIIKNHGDMLMVGQLPSALKNATGDEALSLRTALFYIDTYKRKQMEKHIINLSNLKSFYSIDYFGRNQKLENLLKQTSLYQKGKFYAPSNGYIKNAYRFFEIALGDITRPMIFSDCSGFIQSVARKLHKQNLLCRISDKCLITLPVFMII